MTVAVQGRARKERRDREPRAGLLARLRRSYDQHWYAWVMCTPVVVVLGTLVGYPLVQGVLLTFTNADSLNVGRTIGVNHIPDTYTWIGFHNYVDLLTGTDNQLIPHFVWTIVWTFACVALTVSIGLGLAVLMNRTMRGRTFYRLLLVLPWAVPTFVTVFSWRLLLSDGGAVDGLLGALHLPSPEWLSNPLAMKTAAILVNTWCGVHPHRAVRGRGDGRRDPLAALHPGHPAGPAPGQQHGDPARHHLDLQPVHRDLPAVRRGCQ